MYAVNCQEKTFTVVEEIFTAMNVLRDKRFFAMSKRTALAQMLWDLKEAGDGLSYTKMVARSGKLVSRSALHGVMHGRSQEMTSKTVSGIARILDISEDQVRAAHKNQTLTPVEIESGEKRKLWEMYSDIPPQCQKDVLDLLTVLQKNHSVSKRLERIKGHRKQITRRRVAAASVEDIPGSDSKVGDEPRPLAITSLIGVKKEDRQSGDDDVESDMDERPKRRTNHR